MAQEDREFMNLLRPMTDLSRSEGPAMGGVLASVSLEGIQSTKSTTRMAGTEKVGRRSTRVTIVHTASMLNLRGSEFWVMEVSNLLQEKSLMVRVVNFDYARRYPKNPAEVESRLRTVNAAFGKGVQLTRLAGLSLRLPLGRMFHGTSLEALVDRYLHFLPLRLRFLRLLHQSDVVYYVSSQGNPSYLLAVLGMAVLAGRRPVVAGIHVRLKMNSAELAILKMTAKTGALRAIHTVNRAHEADLRRIGCRVE
jgi:hypothetical protein